MKRPRLRSGIGAVALVAAVGCAKAPAPEQPADTIYTGGNIVTVNDAQPTAEAVAVKDGKILAVGARVAIEKAHKGATTKAVDLGGRTLAPGFVDGHAHILGFGSQAVGANLLAPPDGAANTMDDLVAKLQEFAKGPDVGRTGWIFGLGYDDALLGRHPTRDDLDRVSKDIPVIAVHISGHFSAMNSAGLAKVGYTAANEGRAFAFQHDDLVDAATRGLLDIDVMSYVDYTAKDVLPLIGPTYRGRYRVAGVKITLDGSPQGRTGWRTTPYLLPPDGQKEGYRGYPAISDTKVVAAIVDEAYQKGWPAHVHANGDAAIDQMIEAIRPAHRKYGPGDRRHTLIHGQFLRKDQIPVLKELQIFPSLFPMHTFYWGDWYDQIIGPELAQQISPMRSVLDAGMIATSHTDAPVALPNLMQVMWATVNRTSRSGKVMGPGERLTPIEALKAITLWGAHEHFEEESKGSLEVGKLADMVILSDNPLTIDPARINTIRVIETLKDGSTVYRAE